MSEDVVKIEVDGKVLEARKGQMLIEVTDGAGIRVPRFCYHPKLSVAANCRMCLVDVEKAPKPLPACATPVMDGMKVHTASPRAIAAQKSTMEFLLINHPLDCPICDQGGECELQDVAMGYGGDVSRFAEGKRVVKDKDIGPLIRTEMTRCIHCTRCVRFGEEIANLRELGATGRGEFMEIGTYVEKAVTSELSGNVIDLCPVGALTARPSRYTGRSWEYVQHAAVSPHDAIGANLYLHTLRGKVMRVVPRENEAVNEVWIADRDRFSYEAIYSEDRAREPVIRGETGAEPAEWEAALEAAAAGLRAVVQAHGPQAVGVLVSPSATVEEMYLVQKLARGLGIANIDHRLRQGDFSDQVAAPVYPWLGMPVAELEKVDAALLVGCNVRTEQPLAAHRLRKATAGGGRVMAINPRAFDLRMPVGPVVVTDPAGMVRALAGVARAVAQGQGAEVPAVLRPLVDGAEPGDEETAMAEALVGGDRAVVLLGALSLNHPYLAQLRALAGFVAAGTGAALGYLPEGGNAAGGWLAGVLPHRGPGGVAVSPVGLDARAMLSAPRRAYVLLNVEPEYDCHDPATARVALAGAELVLNLATFAGESARAHSHVILPVGSFAESAGSYINAEGRCQSVQGAARPVGESRPAWKVLRVLGNALGLEGFDYMNPGEILEEALASCAEVEPRNLVDLPDSLGEPPAGGLTRVGEVPLYAVDPTVRRAPALQRTVWASPPAATVHPDTARRLGLAEATQVKVRQNGVEAVLPLVLDPDVAPECVWVPAAQVGTEGLGPAIGPVEVGAA